MKPHFASTLLPSILLLLFGPLNYALSYYDPGTQRWINRDPIAEKGGQNLFGFVGNHPLATVDAFGRIFPGEGPGRLPKPPTKEQWNELCCYAHLARKRGEIMNRASTEARSAPGVGGIGFNGGPEDAVRHCLGGCYLAQEMRRTPSCTGLSADKLIAEEEKKRSSRVTEEDVANGRVGASAPPGASCLDFCLKAWAEGRLKTEDPPPWPVVTP